MTDRVFVDTNVLIYGHYLDSENRYTILYNATKSL